MKYLCLVYLDQEHWSACPDHVCASYAQKLSDSRRLIAGEPLHPVDTATTVRVRNGQVQQRRALKGRHHAGRWRLASNVPS